MAEFSLGSAALGTEIDLGGLRKGIQDARGEAQEAFDDIGGKIGKSLKVGVAAGAAAAVAAITAIGVAAFNVAAEMEQASNTLIAGTAASGEALEDMERRVVNLQGETAGLGRNMDEIAAVMAEVNTRTGDTGDTLESFTGRILNMTRITGDDAVPTVRNVTRVMGDWSVQMEDSEQLMDMLFGAGQTFGIGLDNLTTKLVQFGAPLRQMGFTLEESVALFGKWEKEGVNAELAIGSLRIAAGKFAREGVELRDGLQDVFEAIRTTTSESEALSIAMDTFGARAGPDMAAAIREGRFELDAAVEAMRNTGGAIDDVVGRTLTLEDRWQLAMNNLRTSLIPLGEEIRGLAVDVMPTLTVTMEAVTENVGGALQRLRAGWESDWGGIRTTVEEFVATLGIRAGLILQELNNLWRTIAQLFGGGTEDTERTWEQWWGALVQLTIQLANFVLNQIRAFLQFLRGIFQTIQGLVTGDWDAFWGGLGLIAQAVLQGMLNTVGAFSPDLRRAFEGALRNAWEGLKALWSQIVGWWDRHVSWLFGGGGGGGGAGGFGATLPDVTIRMPPAPPTGPNMSPTLPGPNITVNNQLPQGADGPTFGNMTANGVIDGLRRSGSRR